MGPMSDRSCRGFTLLEVLVAFAILSLTLGVLLRVYASGLRAAVQADGYSRAVLLAQSELERLGREAPLEPGRHAGQWGERYRWRSRIEPFEPDEGPATDQTGPWAPYRVWVTVLWGAGERSRSITLSSVRLGARGP